MTNCITFTVLLLNKEVFSNHFLVRIETSNLRLLPFNDIFLFYLQGKGPNRLSCEGVDLQTIDCFDNTDCLVAFSLIASQY